MAEQVENQESQTAVDRRNSSLIALWYMSYLMNGGMYIGTGWQYNYASGYVMILSALVQFVLAGAVMNHFKKKQLD